MDELDTLKAENADLRDRIANLEGNLDQLQEDYDQLSDDFDREESQRLDAEGDALNLGEALDAVISDLRERGLLT